MSSFQGLRVASNGQTSLDPSVGSLTDMATDLAQANIVIVAIEKSNERTLFLLTLVG